jgi:hypothetical protein
MTSPDSPRHRIDVPPRVQKPLSCQDWAAWIDAMPSGPSKLIVTGTCTFPTPGFGVALKRHLPQGINPSILLLDRIVTPPNGPEPHVITTVPVRYEEPASAGQFDTVSILPDGPTVTVSDVS